LSLKHSPLLLIVVWAGLLVAFMIVRPAPGSPLFWMLIGAATAIGGVYMLLSHRESRQVQREVTAWDRKISELVDLNDFEDDGHLAEYLDDAERRKVIEELERMPPGARSLRRAIGTVAPELLVDDS
jgi:hypothetical protein